MLNFTSIPAPLRDLSGKGELDKIHWPAEAEWAFQMLKIALTILPILRNPDFSQPFLVDTDASKPGLHAVLSQEFEYPVIYVTRKLRTTEWQYATVEREALAIK